MAAYDHVTGHRVYSLSHGFIIQVLFTGLYYCITLIKYDSMHASLTITVATILYREEHWFHRPRPCISRSLAERCLSSTVMVNHVPLDLNGSQTECSAGSVTFCVIGEYA